MISSDLQKWVNVMFAVGMAASQFGMPYLPQYPPMLNMAPPPPPMPVPVPIPLPIPVGIVISEATTTAETTTTTTTTEKPNILKIYLPWLPYNWPIPDFLHSNITLPLPDCNLTFKIPPQMPQPLPMPFVMPPPPPPVIMIPLPLKMVQVSPDDKKSDSSSKSSSFSSSSSDDSDSSDSDSDSSDERRRRHKNNWRPEKRNFGIYRRNRKYNMRSGAQEIQPVLSYVSEDGEIKLSKRLSRKDAAQLLHTATKAAQHVQIIAGNDSNDKSRVLVRAGPVKSTSNHVNKKIVMRNSMQQHGGGNKEIVFRPPNNKKISNFSISFKVER